MSSIRRGSLILAATLAATFTQLSYSAHLAGLPGGTGAPIGVLGPVTGGGSYLPNSCEGNGGLVCDQTKQPEELALCFDGDGDKVCDSRDECLGTPAGEPVFLNGCQPTSETIYVLRGVNFEYDKAAITPESKAILDAGVDTLKQVPDLLASLDGHTDERGSEAYNQDLSFRRAQAVYRYFVNAGISPDRLVFRGFGESVPLDPASNETAWAANRRVEIAAIARWEFDAIKAELGSAADMPVVEDYSEPASSSDDSFSIDDMQEESFDEPAAPAAAQEEEDFNFDDSAPAEPAEEEFDDLFSDDAGTSESSEPAPAEPAASEPEPAAVESEEEAVEEESFEEETFEEEATEEESTVEEEPAPAEEEPAEEEAPSEPSEPMNLEDDDFFSDEDFGGEGGDDEFNMDDLGI